ERDTTSANVISISASRIAEAATPSAASSRSSHSLRLFSGGNALQFLAELLQHHGAVDVALLLRVPDPGLDHRLRLALDFLDQRRVRLVDPHARLLHALVAEAVDFRPGFSGTPREILAAEFADQVPVGLGELVPLIFVGEEADTGNA